VLRTNVLQETFWCFRAAIKRAANYNRLRFLSDSHPVPLCCSPSFIAHPRKPLWGLNIMSDISTVFYIAMGLVYPLSEHVDIFPVRLVSTVGAKKIGRSLAVHCS
jgi:hypothetical protein